MNNESAAAYYLAAAKGRDTHGMARLGNLYARRAGVVRDEKIALKWLTLSAHAGDEWGEWLLERSGFLEESVRLITPLRLLFQRSASHGNKAALYREGLM